MDITQLLIWLAIGGVCGWLAGIVMRDGGGIIFNIVIGIVGAFIAGLIFNRGTINQNPLDLNNFLISLLGSIILLAVVNLLRRGRVR
jgi:uncharacterized membrane protein YeaQ/YmgE (transglycosylase-associated protein family)